MPSGTNISQAWSPPASFKAKRWRKNPEFTHGLPDARLQPLACSEVHPDLYDFDCSSERLLAGVARLVFRHVAESDKADSASTRTAIAYATAVNAGRPTTADFDRDLFFVPSERRSCLQRCWRPCRKNTLKKADKIFELLHSVSEAMDCPSELPVLAAIYIENAISSGAIQLTADNWVPIVVVAFLTASKVWEDICTYNSDYAVILKVAAGLQVKDPKSIYKLESVFLEALEWKVDISAETYASYFWAFRDADVPISHAQSETAWDDMLMQSVASSKSRSSTGSIHGSLIEVMKKNMSSGLYFGDQFDDLSFSGGSSDTKLTYVSSNPDVPVFEAIHEERACPFLKDIIQAPEGKAHITIRDRWSLDRHNPHIGSLRHAQQAAPPSQHINEPKMRKIHRFVASDMLQLPGDFGSSQVIN